MFSDPSTIDRIVAGVLTQIGGGTARSAGDVTTEARRQGGESRTESPESRAVRLDARVITAQVVEGVEAGVRMVVVTPKAVVTPAAWDVARLRGLSIQRGTPVTAPPTASTPAPHSTFDSRLSALLIIVHHTEAVARVWNDVQANWRREFLGCPDDAARLAIAELARGGVKQVVILAEQSHRAACLANRHESVKAAAIHEATDIIAVRSQIRANVWCVDPRNKSWFELRRLLMALDTGH